MICCHPSVGGLRPIFPGGISLPKRVTNTKFYLEDDAARDFEGGERTTQ